MTRPTSDEPPATASRRRLWWLVFGTYALVYGVLLLATSGYPYVLDNNESYSSLWHAHSLYENGIAKTKGLTDEVFAHHPEASPYIHSHQGNFPRLFTFVLYTLGLRTIGPQIWVTTFTVGLAALWLAFRFLSRLGNPLYATLVCLMLMTDYLFFAQWQVSLYNVWHGFFFFSSLVCVQTLGTTERRGRWFVLTLLNFAALFYWEYVFTAFVALLCGLYAVALYRRRFRLVCLAAAAMGIGAALAAGVLLAQLTSYMGWANVIEDVRLTLTARNAAADPVLLDRVTSFYREHHIIFWHNFLDASPLRTVAAGWNSVYQYHLQYYSRPLVVAVALLGFGWLFGAGRRRGAIRGSGSRSTAASVVVKWLLVAGLIGGMGWAALPPPTSLLPRVGLLISSAALAGLVLGRLWTGGWWHWQRLRWGSFIPATIFALGASWLLRVSMAWPDPLPPAGSWIGYGAENLLLIGTCVWGLSAALLGTTHLLGTSRSSRLLSLPALILCGVAAYGGTYRLFTGYVYSGYLHRQIPMAVFLTSLLLALGIYLIVRPLLRVARPRPSAALPRLLSTGLSGLLLLQWLSIQTRWMHIAPPDKYAFLSVLEQPPYRGHSIVSTTYPAPMAARTGSWGYADPSLFSGLVRLTANGYVAERDLKYLWFADRDTNAAYLKPNFAVTVIDTPNIAVAEQLQREQTAAGDAALPLAESLGLVQRSHPLRQAFLNHRVVYSDGHHISIVKLDWDYPPFLRPELAGFLPTVGALSLQEKLVLSDLTQQLRRRWRVSLTPQSSDTGRVILGSANLDGQPLFSAMEMTAAGWQPVTESFASALPGAWQHIDPSAPALTKEAEGGLFQLDLWHSGDAGKIRVEVNDLVDELDLRALAPAMRTFSFSTATPHGRHTYVPAFAPGLCVQTVLPQPGAAAAEIRYHYAHQDGLPEAGTIIRLYREDTASRWHLADTITFLSPHGIPVRMQEFRKANPDTVAEYTRIASQGETRSYEQWLADHLAQHPAEWSRAGIVQECLPAAPPPGPDHSTVNRRVPLPLHDSGRWQYSVTPATRTKRGPEYFGLPFPFIAGSAAAAGPVDFQPPRLTANLPLKFGRLKLQLRFPPRRWPQSEPIVTTGSREAGDFIYVHYPDPEHIRIGFDHWFRGGPLSLPIPVDYSKVYELEISMGSLFPAREDVIFADVSAAGVASVKERLTVKLDGQTIIDTSADCYETNPDSITIGQNAIHGTLCGPVFTGEVLSSKRVWPDIK
ncbi:MAG: hypothetical protein EXS42_09750 [Lacunisphaera sp.]|nr:hypothetical protein [Lacunisphaera sp.]